MPLPVRRHILSSRLLRDAVDLFGAYYLLAGEIRTVRAHEKLLAGNAAIIRARAAAGGADARAAIDLDVALSVLRDRLRRLEAGRAPLSSRLAALAGTGQRAVYAWPEAVPLRPVTDSATFWRMVLERNPELRLARLDLECARQAAALTGRRQAPDFRVGLDWIATGDADQAGVIDSGSLRASVATAAQRRVRPCLMTTATTILALLPVMTSTGRGSDIMVPMAIPTLGGMLIEVMTMFVVPVLYCAKEELILTGWRSKTSTGNQER